MTPDEIEKLAGRRTVSPWIMKLVLEAVELERGACAKVCDAEGREWDSDDQISEKNYAAYCAAAIRARGESRGTDE